MNLLQGTLRFLLKIVTQFHVTSILSTFDIIGIKIFIIIKTIVSQQKQPTNILLYFFEYFASKSILFWSNSLCLSQNLSPVNEKMELKKETLPKVIKQVS